MILLDTHVVLWWRAGDRRLSARARREIERADVRAISPVTCWEVALLERRGRISLDRPTLEWVRDLFAEDRVEQAELTPGAAAAAGLLPDDFPGDPADRLLYATARELAVPLVTKDTHLIDYARSAREVRTIW